MSRRPAITAATKEIPVREGAGRCLLRAFEFGALSGGVLGLAESAKVLVTADARYVQWACKLLAIGGLGYAAIGALLALPCALLALALWGRPTFRSAQPSACAGLATLVALFAFAFTGLPAAWVVPGALAATALFLSLREVLAWWPFVTRLRTWWGLFGALTSVGVAIVAHQWAVGGVQWTGYALALVSFLIALGTLFGKRAPPLAAVATLAVIALAALSHPERRLPETSTAGATDVLLITVDTLRADHVGCYGAADAHTPTIDALARDGVLFEDATSQANTTGPSHTTILSGLYPAEHGALSNGVWLAARTRTLADTLSRTHSTAGFVSGFTLVEEACGLASRFDWYDDQLLAWPWMPRVAERLHLVQSVIRFAKSRHFDVSRADRPAAQTVDAAIDWLHSRGDEALFTWVHMYDPHAPYQPPAEFARLHQVEPDAEPNWYAMETSQREGLVADPSAVAAMHALYKGEISYADAQIARLLEALAATKRLDKTLIVLTSDHGEGLGSHGYWFDHGTYLFDEELHVPLIVRLPRSAHAGVRVKPQVRLLDIAPTVLDVLGIPSAMTTTGASLMPLVNGLPEANERASFALSDTSGDMSGFAIEGRRMSLRSRGHKLIWTSSHWLDTTRVAERTEYYGLALDADEQRDLRAGGNVPAAPFEDLEHSMEKWREATAALKPQQDLDGAVIEQLRKLGYL